MITRLNLLHCILGADNQNPKNGKLFFHSYPFFFLILVRPVYNQSSVRCPVKFSCVDLKMIQYVDENGQNWEPHRMFVRRHICQDCVTRSDVEQFAEVAARERPTFTQSIFIAPNMRYNLIYGDRLVFRYGAPEYCCTRPNNAWVCEPQNKCSQIK